MKGGGKPQPSARLPVGHAHATSIITHLHYAWEEFRDGNVYM